MADPINYFTKVSGTPHLARRIFASLGERDKVVLAEITDTAREMLNAEEKRRQRRQRFNLFVSGSRPAVRSAGPSARIVARRVHWLVPVARGRRLLVCEGRGRPGSQTYACTETWLCLFDITGPKNGERTAERSLTDYYQKDCDLLFRDACSNDSIVVYVWRKGASGMQKAVILDSRTLADLKKEIELYTDSMRKFAALPGESRQFLQYDQFGGVMYTVGKKGCRRESHKLPVSFTQGPNDRFDLSTVDLTQYNTNGILVFKGELFRKNAYFIRTLESERYVDFDFNYTRNLARYATSWQIGFIVALADNRVLGKLRDMSIMMSYEVQCLKSNILLHLHVLIGCMFGSVGLGGSIEA